MDWCRTAGRVAPCGQTVTLLGWPFFLEYSEEEANTSKMMRDFSCCKHGVSSGDTGVIKSRAVSGCFGKFHSFFSILSNSYQ